MPSPHHPDRQPAAQPTKAAERFKDINEAYAGPRNRLERIEQWKRISLDTDSGHHPRQLFYLFGVVAARYTHPHWAVWVGLPVDDYWPFFTSMFLHGGWLHIIANMWTLWIFGDNVEDRMGPLRFVVFHLLCGFIMALHIVFVRRGRSGRRLARDEYWLESAWVPSKHWRVP